MPPSNISNQAYFATLTIWLIVILHHPEISYSLIQQARASIFVFDRGNRVVFQNSESKKVFEYILRELRALGLGIARDDFGTGYSSRSCLGTLMLGKLKIDHSFIGRLDRSHSIQTLTDSIIGLGRAMNLQVVGEAIESAKAMESLKKHGYSQSQGYLYSKPLSPGEFEAWHRSRTMRLH